jgi:uncharacterized membrane protein YraQ (UPF0718 family)/copper chaperone CopZ
VGVPLPLCSCGVIPTGVSFHKNGASKGAAVSFLISTPQTGVDSILVTYSLMGLPFAIIRPIAAFITGIVGGAFTNQVDEKVEVVDTVSNQTSNDELTRLSFGEKIIKMLRYAFIDFLQDIAKWLLIGLAIAALITVLIPDSLFEQYLSNPYLNMILILVASVPMYVCATGSIPIATALMLKGISPGAAFVFLMAGPATNAGTITVIGQSLGRKALITYLASIIGGALVFGVIINEFLPTVWFTGMLDVVHHHHFLPAWLELGSSWILLALLIYGVISPYLNRMIQKSNKKQVEMELKYHVNGMTCNHCKASVENNLQKIEGVKSVEVDLVSKTVSVDAEGVIDSKVEHTINELGFEFGGKA